MFPKLGVTSLDQADSRPKHFSCYCLCIDSGSCFVFSAVGPASAQGAIGEKSYIPCSKKSPKLCTVCTVLTLHLSPPFKSWNLHWRQTALISAVFCVSAKHDAKCGVCCTDSSNQTSLKLKQKLHIHIHSTVCAHNTS